MNETSQQQMSEVERDVLLLGLDALQTAGWKYGMEVSCPWDESRLRQSVRVTDTIIADRVSTYTMTAVTALRGRSPELQFSLVGEGNKLQVVVPVDELEGWADAFICDIAAIKPAHVPKPRQRRASKAR